MIVTAFHSSGRSSKYFAAGADKSIFPASSNCITATDVKTFVQERSQNCLLCNRNIILKIGNSIRFIERDFAAADNRRPQTGNSPFLYFAVDDGSILEILDCAESGIAVKSKMDAKIILKFMSVV